MSNLTYAYQALCHRSALLLWVIGFFAATLSFTSTAATLSAQVDRTQIGLEETVNLTVRYDEQLMFGEPDFSAIGQNFDIISNRKANQYRNVNGQVESWTQWSLTLAPKKEGVLLIPSFSYKGATSAPIKLTVKKSSTQSVSGSGQPLFLETEISDSTGFVQEQLLYTIRLFTSVDLSGVNNEEFSVDNALVKQVAEAQYKKTVQGQLYGVVEITYAIFPQQSGTLVLPSTLWNISVQNQRSFGYDPFARSNSKLVRLRTEEKTVQVLPKPENYSGQHWLPATDISLSQKWSRAPSQFKVGEPITRSITIHAKGLMASQLPPFELAPVDGLKYYPDQPQSDEALSSNGITTSKTESYAIVPSQAGQLTLPEVALTWWDTEQKQMRTATLPTETLTISGGAVEPVADPDPKMTANTLTPPTVAQQTSDPALLPQDNSLWISLTAIFASTTLLFIWLWLRAITALPKRSISTQPQPTNESESSAWKKLMHALKAEQPTAIRQSILDWAKTRETAKNIDTLSQLASEIPELKTVLEQLETHLYSGEESLFNSDELLKQLKIIRQKKSKKPPAQADAIAPLYR